MTALNPINQHALITLNRARNRLTPQQFKTIRGQVLAGDTDGAMRGLLKLIKKPKERTDAHDRPTRQDPGRRTW